MALAGLTFGCGDDDSTPGGAGSSSGSSTGAPTTGTPTTTGVDSSTGVGSGSASESGESSSSTGPEVEVTVEGEVIDFVLSQSIPESEISIYDDPSITATADDMGMFSIGTFTPNTGALFVLAPLETHWGAIIPVDIGSEPLQQDVELTQISTNIVDMQIMGLEGQDPVPAELERAIVIVRLLNNAAVMEGDVTVEMDPAPDPGTFYAPDPGGAPILDQNLIQWSVIPVVVYFNVDDTDPGDISITATHPTRECTVLYPELPTIGEHMTLFDVQCLAP